jgi:hypothetical protein
MVLDRDAQQKMKDNKLTIRINKPVHEVYLFTITPPNSTRWIAGIIDESADEWPIRKGTVYTLRTKAGVISEVTVNEIKCDSFIEWISKDRNYHCKYTFKPIDENLTILEYSEWVGIGELIEPFTIGTLQTLKSALEK